jgi:uncharacterized protein YoxC
MDTNSQSQVFFFISSIGFVTLWVFVGIFLFYLIRTTSTLSRIMEKVEENVDNVGDVTREMLEDMRDSMVFNFLFGKKKRKTKEKK